MKVTAKTALVTFVALLLLTAASVIATWLPLGGFHVAVALVIAAIKTVLVALFFMHLIEEPISQQLAAVAAVSLVVILVTLSMADVITRV